MIGYFLFEYKKRENYVMFLKEVVTMIVVTVVTLIRAPHLFSMRQVLAHILSTSGDAI